jgi:hypothetical protein
MSPGRPPTFHAHAAVLQAQLLQQRRHPLLQLLHSRHHVVGRQLLAAQLQHKRPGRGPAQGGGVGRARRLWLLQRGDAAQRVAQLLAARQPQA